MSTAHSQTLRLLRDVPCETTQILIVEDNDASRRLVQELLRATGFARINFARDAEDALNQLRSTPPDLILMDWELPGMSGIDLVRTIRAAVHAPDPRIPNPEIPIIMLTARQRQRDVTMARNAGINDFVIKPFSTASLLKSIVTTLVKRRRFIVSESFTGPDRRSGRRRAETYPGILMRRRDDSDASVGLKQVLVRQAGRLRDLLRGGGVIPVGSVDELTDGMYAAQAEAHGQRLKLVEETTRSLNEYVRHFGPAAEIEVLDVHLDALLRLNDVPYADNQEAMNIVSHLKQLVQQRQNRRRVR